MLLLHSEFWAITSTELPAGKALSGYEVSAPFACVCAVLLMRNHETAVGGMIGGSADVDRK